MAASTRLIAPSPAIIWLLGGYMWLSIHRPFEVWPWLGDLHIERMYMIVTILYWAIAVDKHWIQNRLNAAFLCFTVVLVFSWLASPYHDQGTTMVEGWFKMTVFYVLVVTSVRHERDLKLLMILFLGAMSLYVAHSFREYLCGRHEYRMGVKRMIGVGVAGSDPNSFGMTVLYSIPLIWPLWWDFKGAWVSAAAGWLLDAGVRLHSADRFSGGLRRSMYSTGHYNTSLEVPRENSGGAYRGRAAVWFSLRTDLQNRFLTLIDPSYGPANAQASAESRWQGWHDGVRIWKEQWLLVRVPVLSWPLAGPVFSRTSFTAKSWAS